MDNFKEIFKDLIIEHNLSLRKIFLDTNIATTRLSSYLNGFLPSIKTAVTLSNYFNCSVDYLFGLSEQKTTCKLSSTYDMTKFVPRYNKCLEENKISHWKLCQTSDLNESSLRKWKKGTIPKIDSLIIISKELSTSIDYLIGRC